MGLLRPAALLHRVVPQSPAALPRLADLLHPVVLLHPAVPPHPSQPLAPGGQSSGPQARRATACLAAADGFAQGAEAAQAQERPVLLSRPHRYRSSAAHNPIACSIANSFINRMTITEIEPCIAIGGKTKESPAFVWILDDIGRRARTKEARVDSCG